MVATPAPKASLINSCLGPYAIEALVGRGAMGAVYLARDRVLHRKVALKVLLGSLARNQQAIRQFRLEAQAAAPLRHPNIVRIYEAGIREGTPFIAMEYIEGESLEQFLQRTPILSWQQALHVAGQVTAALACAHEAGIIHRDVKPANMLIDRSGRIRLTDFGIANHQGLNESASATGMGTLEYMAPEQFGGAVATPQSDLFAVGVVLFRMLTGAMPFQGGSPEALMHNMSQSKPANLRQLAPGVPDDVARLTLRLLSRNPQERPQDGPEVLGALDRLQREKGGSSALPEALDAFIREQSRAREIDAGPHTPVKTRGKKGAKPSVARRFLVPMAASVGLVVAGSLFAVAGLAKGRDVIPEATLLDGTMSQWREASVELKLGQGGWRPQALAWDAQGKTLTTLLKPASNQGAGRGAAIEVDYPARQIRFRGALGDPWIAQSGRESVHERMDFLATGDTLYFSRWTEGPLGGIQIYPSRSGKQGAELRPLVSIPENRLPMAMPVYGQRPPVAFHPEKRWAGLVLQDTRDGGAYVSLLDLRSGSQARDSRSLTAPDRSIMPWPLRFSEKGDSLFFFRHNGAQERSLWRVRLPNGIEEPVAVGPFQVDTLALSPDGEWVALSTGRATPEIMLYPVNGGVPIHGGPGMLGPSCWLPGSKALVAAVQDEAGLFQATRISFMGGVTREALSAFPGGIEGVPVVASASQLCAVVLPVYPPQIAFLNLSAHQETPRYALQGEAHVAAR